MKLAIVLKVISSYSLGNYCIFYSNPKIRCFFFKLHLLVFLSFRWSGLNYVFYWQSFLIFVLTLDASFCGIVAYPGLLQNPQIFEHFNSAFLLLHALPLSFLQLHEIIFNNISRAGFPVIPERNLAGLPKANYPVDSWTESSEFRPPRRINLVGLQENRPHRQH